MRTYLRIQSPLSQLAIFLLLVAGGIFITMITSSAVLFSSGLVSLSNRNLDFTDPKTVSVLKLIQGSSSITIFFIPSIAFALFTFNYRPLFFLGFRKQNNSKFYLLAIAILLVSFPFVGWLGELNEHIPLAKWMTDTEKEAGNQMRAFLKVVHPSDIFVNIFLIAVLPAICEEVFFRGCLQRILIFLFKSPWAGIIVAAALFSAFHFQFAGFFPRMFLGILLGAIFWYSNSLWASILAHFLNNAFQVVAVYYYPKMIDENPQVPIYLALISGALVFGLLWVLRKQSSVSYEKIYDFEKVNEHNQFIA